MPVTTTPASPLPIYRHLLSGAPDTYRLPLRSLLLVVAAGTALLAISLASGRPLQKTEAAVGRSAERMLSGGSLLASGTAASPVVDVAPVDSWTVALAMRFLGRYDWVVRLPSALATLATAVLVAVLATRWFGRRVGLVAALVFLTTAGVLVSIGVSGSDAWLTLCVTGAFGAFGLGTAAGRHPIVHQRWVGCVYYGAAGVSFLLAGPVGPLFILAGSFLYLYLGEDPRSLKFYASPAGIALFLAIAALWPAMLWLARPAGFEGHLYGWFAGVGVSPGRLIGDVVLASLPWMPLSALALVVAMWRGHAFAPAWRLFASWTLGPLALMSIGLFRGQPHVGIVLPPLAVMAGVAVVEVLRWAGRSPQTRTAGAAAVWLALSGVALVVLRYGGPLELSGAALPIAAAAAALLPVLAHRALSNRRRVVVTGRVA